jgi:hypothetical protein
LGDEHAFKVLSWAYGVLKSQSTKAEHLAQLQPAMPGSLVIVHSLKTRLELNDLAGFTSTWDGLRIMVTLLNDGRSFRLWRQSIRVVPPTVPGIGGVSFVQAFPGGGPGFLQAASDRKELVFIFKRWNTAGDMDSEYCTVCKRWADESHVQYAKHIARCASPGANGSNGTNFAQALSSCDPGADMR